VPVSTHEPKEDIVSIQSDAEDPQYDLQDAPKGGVNATLTPEDIAMDARIAKHLAQCEATLAQAKEVVAQGQSVLAENGAGQDDLMASLPPEDRARVQAQLAEDDAEIERTVSQTLAAASFAAPERSRNPLTSKPGVIRQLI
jgi:hypothetical protein